MMMANVEEEQNLTFKPEINPISRYFGRPEHEKLEDYLNQKAKSKQDRIDKKRSELIFSEHAECKFKP